MKLFLTIVLSLFCGLAYAENRIYVDNSKDFEVVDVSGLKTLAQINTEFNGNFTEVTAERKAKVEANKVLSDKVDEKNILIQTKIREQAIATLQAEGKLDVKGDIIK